MKQYKQEFIKFMISCGVLKFGGFVIKSGKEMPFLVSIGFYRTGMQLEQLGAYYARVTHAAFGKEMTLPFEPAYKGIPPCVAASAGMSELYKQEVGYVADRKEAKDHSDKEILPDAPIRDNDKIVIVEDATTAETLIEGTTPIIKAQGSAEILGLVVNVDRCERDKGKKSAFSEISERHGIKTITIVTMRRVTGHLCRREVNSRVVIGDALMGRVDVYYHEYGVEED